MSLYQSSDEAIEAAVQAAEPDLTPYFALQWLWHRTRISAAVEAHFPVDIPEPTYGRALANWAMASPSKRSEWLPGTVHSYIEFRLEELVEYRGGSTVLPDPVGEAEVVQWQAEEARLEAQHQAELQAELRAERSAQVARFV